MDATVLEIAEKVKERSVGQTALDNFVVRDGGSVDLSILDQPTVSLYCLDDEAQRAIFVETPPGADLDAAPFYYVAQYEQAQRLIAVPIEDFHRVADTLPTGDLIFVHSTGRCGSTLISQALATVEGVRSLSEPDIYTQIHLMRFLDHTRDAEYQRLLASATRFYTSRSPTTAIKFRAMCISVGDLLGAAFPDAKNLFLYRHAETWVRSMNLEMRPIEVRRVPLAEQDIPRHWMGIAPLIIPFSEQHGRMPTPNELMALGWVSLMAQYLALHEAGHPFLAVRYEDIKAQPKAVLAAIFDYCGLEADVDRAYEVFGKDSQAGTEWSQEQRQQRAIVPLEDEDYAQFRAVISEHPVIRSADFIAPGTLDLSGG